MRKLLSAIAIVTLIAFVGCKESGVPQEEHDKVKQELEDAKADIEELEMLLDETLAAFEECEELLEKNKIPYQGTKPPKKDENKDQEKDTPTDDEKDRETDVNQQDRNEGTTTPEGQKQRN